MSIVIFLGPTLPVEKARDEVEALFMPPVAQGDVYRVAQRQPEVIAIVDGQFDQVPAVWHKEILWAMSRGIHVYGAASMGALRAAELCSFGMEGIGAIFEAYRDGTIEDDDEVAVAYLPAAADYRPTSESMVNIRFTLAQAERSAVIGSATRLLLESLAKALFYPERSWLRLLELARRQGGCDSAELDAFARWLPEGSVDQKRADALLLLKLLRERHSAGSSPKQISYTFQHTILWQYLVETAEVVAAGEDGPPLPLTEVLDELWLEPAVCVSVHREALIRHLCLEPSSLGDGTGSGVTPQAEAELHSQLGFETDDERKEWLRRNHLSPNQFAFLAREQAVFAQRLPPPHQYRHRVLEQLRLSGLYPEFTARALRKSEVLAAHGLEDRGEGTEELETEVLMHWYAAHPQAGPDYALFLELARAGWRDFIRALVRQHYYESVTAARPG